MIATATPSTNGKPKAPQTGQLTGRQSPLWGPGGVGVAGGWWGTPGGSAANPLAFPGWLEGGGYWQTYQTYRFMLQHPMIRSVRERVFGTVCSSPWAIEVDDDVPDDAKQYLERHFGTVHDESMPEFLRCLDYGHSCFEAVWDQDADGYYCVTFKPLWPEWTSIVEDYAGEFIGFNVALRTDLTDAQRKAAEAFAPAPATGNGAVPQPIRPTLPVAASKALLVTYDGEAGNLWGRSQLENLRHAAWIPWLLCAQQLAALGAKISGRQAYAMAPVGAYTDPAKGERTFMQDAQDALNYFAEGKSPVLANLAIEADDPDLKAKLAGASLVKFEAVDFGDNSPAIAGLLEQMGHYETLMWHGYLQSPRSGMESEHGSRADAEAHSSNDTYFTERLARFITRHIQPFVDETCRLNWGLNPGQCRLVQTPITDPLLVFKQSVFNSLVQNTTTGPIILRAVGLGRLFGDLQIPLNPGVKLEDIDGMVQEQQQQEQEAKLAQAQAADAAKAKGGPPGATGTPQPTPEKP